MWRLSARFPDGNNNATVEQTRLGYITSIDFLFKQLSAVVDCPLIVTG